MKPDKITVLILLLLTTFLNSPIAAQESATKDSVQQAISAEVVVKTQHNFLLYLPDNYEQKEAHPLMLFLHGAGERGDHELDKVKIHGPPKQIENGKNFPCIVVSPQCRKNGWWEAAELSALLDYLEANYKVDKDRIYVTGLSMGGYGTWSLALRESKRFAAIAPICGGGDALAARYTRAITVPTWAFHGAKDRVVQVSESQKMVDVLKENNVEVKFTIYPDVGHDAWEQAYEGDELYDWLFSHSRAPQKE